MNILQINASYKPAYVYGGPTMSVSKLSEQLVKSGQQVQVFCTTANGQTELPAGTLELGGVRVRYFKRITKDHSHCSPALLFTLWKEVRSFNIVHIHAWWNLVSVLSCLIAHCRSVPVVLSPRGTLSNYSFTNRHTLWKGLFHRFVGRSLLNRCYIHATSAAEAKAMAALLKPKGMCTIHNAVNLPEAIPPPAVPEGETLKLIFLSRIDPKKGLELLFAALAGISVPYQLSIAGNGDAAYIKSLKNLSRSYKIDRCIRWLGFMQNSKFDLLARHHLLVLPSHDENFGNVVIESLSVGTPVLLSRQVGLSHYVEQQQLGWTCETNAASIRKQLSAIYSLPEQLAAIRESAPQTIRNQFNDDKLIREYLDMYQTTALSHV